MSFSCRRRWPSLLLTAAACVAAAFPTMAGDSPVRSDRGAIHRHLPTMDPEALAIVRSEERADKGVAKPRFLTAWVVQRDGYLVTSTRALETRHPEPPGTAGGGPGPGSIELEAEFWSGGKVVSMAAHPVLVNRAAGLVLLHIRRPLPHALRLASTTRKQPGPAHVARLWMPPGGLAANTALLAGIPPSLESRAYVPGTFLDLTRGAADSRWAGAPVLDERGAVIGVLGSLSGLGDNLLTMIPLADLRAFLDDARFLLRVKPSVITASTRKLAIALEPLLDRTAGWTAEASLAGLPPAVLHREGTALHTEMALPPDGFSEATMTVSLAVSIRSRDGATTLLRSLDIPVLLGPPGHGGDRRGPRVVVTDDGMPRQTKQERLAALASTVQLHPKALTFSKKPPRAPRAPRPPERYAALQRDQAKRWATRWDDQVDELSAANTSALAALTGDGSVPEDRTSSFQRLLHRRQVLLKDLELTGLVLEALHICTCPDQRWYPKERAPCGVDCRLLQP